MSGTMKDADSLMEHVSSREDKLRKAEEYIAKLKNELKEKEAEKAHYLRENEFLKESLRRLAGL